ncbi:class I SAM-dependent RNA methyltransferase [Subtercola frigoramans]|uniref:tRNA/tmRNA/rRNA uracil-C5-methylase (TrmA/RlmC/RlmD family) n=1 Tax=Subtercola frigoramans TaxID=120298 RepID=A0ABS2L8J3_9MICO|nr:TRAM domain-containing protein [Subtercola frigoramans]MBM7473314.1 tRNA/tmRNA/rRNA uracil-C5-methylase (TrmA/RlmC/RlmD family) [Subtercola frigoramans]
MSELVGTNVELEVTNVAHGGVAVARLDGRVVFVADSLPGETVLARISSADHKSFWRAEAIEVIEPSAHRRPHVWESASIDRDPDRRAGGAEFGHIELGWQRELKRQVLVDSLQRFAKLDTPLAAEVIVEAVEGDDAANGLGWRTRVSLHVDDQGIVGPYAARSHRVVAVPDLPLATQPVEYAAPLDERVFGADRIDVISDGKRGARVVLHRPEAVDHAGESAAGRGGRGPGKGREGGRGGAAISPGAASSRGSGRSAKSGGNAARSNGADSDGYFSDDNAPRKAASGGYPPNGPAQSRASIPSYTPAPPKPGKQIVERVGEREFRLEELGFWQVHHGAARTLTAALQQQLLPELFDPAAANLDLYGGVGLLAGALADRFGTKLRIESVESDWRATANAEFNLRDVTGATAVTARVDRYLADRVRGVTAAERAALARASVILDPPRAGAGKQVVGQLLDLAPAQIAYVACDPVAFARDLALFREGGYELRNLRAFDLFPHTHHVEALGVLTRG